MTDDHFCLPERASNLGLQRVDQTWSMMIISKSRVGLVRRLHLRKLGRCNRLLRETKSSSRATTISDPLSRGRGTKMCGGPMNIRESPPRGRGRAHDRVLYGPFIRGHPRLSKAASGSWVSNCQIRYCTPSGPGESGIRARASVSLVIPVQYPY